MFLGVSAHFVTISHTCKDAHAFMRIWTKVMRLTLLPVVLHNPVIQQLMVVMCQQM